MASSHASKSLIRNQRSAPPKPRHSILTMSPESSVVNELVGTYRTFGAEGPLYEVQREVDENTLHILVVQSGEELDYPVKDAMADPEAK